MVYSELRVYIYNVKWNILCSYLNVPSTYVYLDKLVNKSN